MSFVEVMSPCVTWRPDERQWKKQVHPSPVPPTADAAQAARRLMTDDGLNIGILYKGDRAPFAPLKVEHRAEPAALEAEFAL